MARYRGPKEKIERRLGERLYLKGERSFSPKSAMVKKPYPPGMHGHNRARKPSEYALQLKAKQKVKNIYRLLEKQFKNYIKSALASREDPYTKILHILERRLDNAVFRMGLAQSRDQAKQLVGHGHILVNGRKVSTPSCQIKKDDVISVREGSQRSPFFSTLAPQWFQKYEAPAWLEVDKVKMTARIKGFPTLEESGLKPDDLQAIIEFYSR